MIARTAFFLFFLVVGCASGERERNLISREQFIQVNVDLREIRRDAADADERRAQVLEQHGVTEQQVLDFIERGNHTPGQLREIWAEITRRLEASDQERAASRGGREI